MPLLESKSGGKSGGDAIGIGLACGIPLVLGLATVLVRRYSAIRMTPRSSLRNAIFRMPK